ncbi:MAG: MrtC family glutamic-type intramembrane protease [Sandaracinaceae bacterium]|nr:MrtC family glutamic-type intramembrane protease [Sandaracinaceae bacterium]
MHRVLLEVLSVYALLFGGTLIFSKIGELGGWLGELGNTAIPLSLWLSAQEMATRRGGARRFGIDLGGLWGESQPQLFALLGEGLKELGVAVALAVLIFPPFALGFALWHNPPHPFEWRIPQAFTAFVIAQFLVVALPEEAFFRGYVQTRLHDCFVPRFRWLGAEFHPLALVIQALLFALIHLASEARIEKLATFFPGLVFGGLRAWWGGIGASLCFHALSNVFAEFLVEGWLRPS